MRIVNLISLQTHLLASAILLANGVTTVRAQDPAGAPPVEAAPSQRNQVDVQISRGYVRIAGTGLYNEHAAEGRLSAGGVFLGAQTNAGMLIFDMASFIADTPDSRREFGLSGGVDDPTREKITQHMFSMAVLDVDHHPQAKFRINSALPTGPARQDGSGEYELEGEFTLRGATRPVRLTVLVEPVDGKWHLRGQFKIKQSDFGIKPYVKAFNGVADLLVIHGDIWIYR